MTWRKDPHYLALLASMPDAQNVDQRNPSRTAGGETVVPVVPHGGRDFGCYQQSFTTQFWQ